MEKPGGPCVRALILMAHGLDDDAFDFSAIVRDNVRDDDAARERASLICQSALGTLAESVANEQEHRATSRAHTEIHVQHSGSTGSA